MQDLKTGHLIRASPRAQFFGQLIGSCLSIIVTTTAYSLYQRAYEIPGPSFPAPTAFVWLGLARLLRTYRYVGGPVASRRLADFSVNVSSVSRRW